MAGEIQVPAGTGLALYAIVLDAAGLVHNGAAFVVIEADDWANYDRPLAEADGTGLYLGDFPAIAAGTYAVLAYRRVGGAPAISDPVIAAGDLRWTGTAREPVQTGDSFGRIGANGAGLTSTALAATGLDAIPVTAPSGVATTFREMIVQTWRRFFRRATKDGTQIRTYADNGTTVLTTQAITSAGSDETVGTAT